MCACTVYIKIKIKKGKKGAGVARQHACVARGKQSELIDELFN